MVMVSTFLCRVTSRKEPRRRRRRDNQNVSHDRAPAADVGQHFMINKPSRLVKPYHAVQRHHAAKAAFSKMIKSPRIGFFHDATLPTQVY